MGSTPTMRSSFVRISGKLLNFFFTSSILVLRIYLIPRITKFDFYLFTALLWADILVKYALFELQDYLTGTWGLSFTHAAGIINIPNGINLILQPLFLLCIGRFLRNFGMLVISSSAYTLAS